MLNADAAIAKLDAVTKVAEVGQQWINEELAMAIRAIEEGKR